MFQYESGSTGFESARSIADIGMHGQKNNPDATIEFFDLPDGIDAIELRHRDIHHNQIRLQSFGFGDKGSPIFHRTDDFKLGFKKAAQTLEHDPVIIGKKDPGFFHMAFSIREVREGTLFSFRQNRKLELEIRNKFKCRYDANTVCKHIGLNIKGFDHCCGFRASDFEFIFYFKFRCTKPFSSDPRRSSGCFAIIWSVILPASEKFPCLMYCWARA